MAQGSKFLRFRFGFFNYILLQQCFRSFNLLKERDFSEYFKKKVKTWTFQDLVLSLVVFKFEGKILNFLDWSFLTCLLLHSKVSKEVFLLIHKNNFYEILGRNQVIKGCCFALKNYSFFYNDEKSLRNLLNFLKLDYFNSNTLIFQSLKEKNCKSILDFLEENFNQKLILKKCNSKAILFWTNITENKKLEPIILTIFQFSLILVAVRSRLYLQPYKKSFLPHINTKTATVYVSQASKSKKMGQTPFASLTEMWRIAVADSNQAPVIQSPIIVTGSTPGPGRVILPHSVTSAPRYSVQKPGVKPGMSKHTLSITRTPAQSQSYIHKSIRLGRGLQTSLIANHINWNVVFHDVEATTLTNGQMDDFLVEAETAEMENLYAG
jgi:hypothetical protein